MTRQRIGHRDCLLARSCHVHDEHQFWGTNHSAPHGIVMMCEGYSEPTTADAPNVQHIALLPDGTWILVTIFNSNPHHVEVCTRSAFADRWAPPLPLTSPFSNHKETT